MSLLLTGKPMANHAAPRAGGRPAGSENDCGQPMMLFRALHNSRATPDL